MNNIKYRRAVGLYYSREEVEQVVQALKKEGYDMDKVTVIARDNDNIAGHETTQEIGNKADEGAATGAIAGGALGGITGLLVGLGTLAIPGIGPILLAGAEATAIATTVAGGAIGAAAGSLIGALIGLGIPEEKARMYSDRVAQGSFLVMVTGTTAEIARAESIMNRYGVEEFEVYDAAPPATTNPNTSQTFTEKEPKEQKVTTQSPVNHHDTDMTEEERIKLYEERLVVDKEREKAGEVAVGKRVAKETAEVSVPVEKERIVVERRDVNNGVVNNPTKINFQDREVAHIDVYEESADIEKQAFVREEVTIRKEVEEDTINAQEKIRREKLDIDTEGDVVQK